MLGSFPLPLLVVSAIGTGAPAIAQDPYTRGDPAAMEKVPCRGTIKPPRPGSIRARLVEILSRGATFDEVCATLGLSKAGAYDHIRLVHVAGGYGVREGEDGVIRLVAA